MRPVAIRHPQDPTRPTVIPGEMFDPVRHERWVEPVQDYLPDDLPGRAALVSAGFVTLHGVLACEDYSEVPGIGEATEARLRAYLARSYGDEAETPVTSSPGVPPTGPGPEVEAE